MQNPTIVVITDRNDLDEKLFDTFAAAQQLLRQEPVQAGGRNQLKTINDSAVQVLGDDNLREVAREIAEKVKANTTIDRTIRESARARLMEIVKRTLNKYGYPPDKQQKAIDTVMQRGVDGGWVDELTNVGRFYLL